MILTCPACGTQYVVKDGAIPPQGRQVRCAACRHSWHQDPEGRGGEEPLAAPPPEESVAPEADEAPVIPAGPSDDQPQEAHILAEPAGASDMAAPPAEGLVEAPMSAPIPPDEDDSEGIGTVPPEGYQERDLEEQPHEPASIAGDDEFSPFASYDEREPEPRSPILAVLLIALIVALLAAAFWFLAPVEWKQRLGIAGAGDTPLQLMMTHSDRQRLASGNELLAISGRVINPTEERQKVPPIYAQLHDQSGQLVHSWTIAPPASTLAPGQSASFNSAEVNVPSGGDELTVTLGSPRA